MDDGAAREGVKLWPRHVAPNRRPSTTTLWPIAMSGCSASCWRRTRRRRPAARRLPARGHARTSSPRSAGIAAATRTLGGAATWASDTAAATPPEPRGGLRARRPFAPSPQGCRRRPFEHPRPGVRLAPSGRPHHAAVAGCSCPPSPSPPCPCRPAAPSSALAAPSPLPPPLLLRRRRDLRRRRRRRRRRPPPLPCPHPATPRPAAAALHLHPPRPPPPPPPPAAPPATPTRRAARAACHAAAAADGQLLRHGAMQHAGRRRRRRRRRRRHLQPAAAAAAADADGVLSPLLAAPAAPEAPSPPEAARAASVSASLGLRPAADGRRRLLLGLRRISHARAAAVRLHARRAPRLLRAAEPRRRGGRRAARRAARLRVPLVDAQRALRPYWAEAERV